MIRGVAQVLGTVLSRGMGCSDFRYCRNLTYDAGSWSGSDIIADQKEDIDPRRGCAHNCVGTESLQN